MLVSSQLSYSTLGPVSTWMGDQWCAVLDIGLVRTGVWLLAANTFMSQFFVSTSASDWLERFIVEWDVDRVEKKTFFKAQHGGFFLGLLRFELFWLNLGFLEKAQLDGFRRFHEF